MPSVLETRKPAGLSSAWADRNGLWARKSAIAGAVVWALVAVLARIGVVRVGAIELLFVFAPLVLLPLGLELGRLIGGSNRTAEIAQSLQPLGALFAVMAICIPPGKWAAVAALGWLAVCLSAGTAAISDVLFNSSNADKMVRLALAIAGIDLVVGGTWFVASRLGKLPLGIQEPIGLLTAVHFHFAGFATATIVAATLHFAAMRGDARFLRTLTPVVIGMPFVVAAGFVISPLLKMIAAMLFSLGIAALAVFLRAMAKQAARREARHLLQVAAAAVFAALVLAGAYAVADFTGSDALTMPQMARTHGLLNAVGFCLPGLLGWLIEISPQPGS